MSCNPIGSRKCVSSINPYEKCAKEPRPIEISEIPYEELISDYYRIAELEKEYFSLCRKYSPDTTYEEDDAFRIIAFELVSRAVNGKNCTDLNNLKSKLRSEDRRLLRGTKEISKQIRKIQRKVQQAKDSFATGGDVDEKAIIHLADKLAALKNQMSSIKGRHSLVKKLLKEDVQQ